MSLVKDIVSSSIINELDSIRHSSLSGLEKGATALSSAVQSLSAAKNETAVDSDTSPETSSLIYRASSDVEKSIRSQERAAAAAAEEAAASSLVLKSIRAHIEALESALKETEGAHIAAIASDANTIAELESLVSTAAHAGLQYATTGPTHFRLILDGKQDGHAEEGAESAVTPSQRSSSRVLCIPIAPSYGDAGGDGGPKEGSSSVGGTVTSFEGAQSIGNLIAAYELTVGDAQDEVSALRGAIAHQSLQLQDMTKANSHAKKKKIASALSSAVSAAAAAASTSQGSSLSSLLLDTASGDGGGRGILPRGLNLEAIELEAKVRAIESFCAAKDASEAYKREAGSIARSAKALQERLQALATGIGSLTSSRERPQSPLKTSPSKTVTASTVVASPSLPLPLSLSPAAESPFSAIENSLIERYHASIAARDAAVRRAAEATDTIRERERLSAEMEGVLKATITDLEARITSSSSAWSAREGALLGAVEDAGKLLQSERHKHQENLRRLEADFAGVLAANMTRETAWKEAVEKSKDVAKTVAVAVKLKEEQYEAQLRGAQQSLQRERELRSRERQDAEKTAQLADQAAKMQEAMWKQREAGLLDQVKQAQEDARIAQEAADIANGVARGAAQDVVKKLEQLEEFSLNAMGATVDAAESSSSNSSSSGSASLSSNQDLLHSPLSPGQHAASAIGDPKTHTRGSGGGSPSKGEIASAATTDESSLEDWTSQALLESLRGEAKALSHLRDMISAECHAASPAAADDRDGSLLRRLSKLPSSPLPVLSTPSNDMLSQLQSALSVVTQRSLSLHCTVGRRLTNSSTSISSSSSSSSSSSPSTASAGASCKCLSCRFEAERSALSLELSQSRERERIHDTVVISSLEKLSSQLSSSLLDALQASQSLSEKNPSDMTIEALRANSLSLEAAAAARHEEALEAQRMASENAHLLSEWCATAASREVKEKSLRESMTAAVNHLEVTSKKLALHLAASQTAVGSFLMRALEGTVEGEQHLQALQDAGYTGFDSSSAAHFAAPLGNETMAALSKAHLERNELVAVWLRQLIDAKVSNLSPSSVPSHVNGGGALQRASHHIRTSQLASGFQEAAAAKAQATSRQLACLASAIVALKDAVVSRDAQTSHEVQALRETLTSMSTQLLEAYSALQNERRTRIAETDVLREALLELALGGGSASGSNAHSSSAYQSRNFSATLHPSSSSSSSNSSSIPAHSFDLAALLSPPPPATASKQQQARSAFNLVVTPSAAAAAAVAALYPHTYSSSSTNAAALGPGSDSKNASHGKREGYSFAETDEVQHRSSSSLSSSSPPWLHRAVGGTSPVKKSPEVIGGDGIRCNSAPSHNKSPKGSVFSSPPTFSSSSSSSAKVEISASQEGLTPPPLNAAPSSRSASKEEHTSIPPTATTTMTAGGGGGGGGGGVSSASFISPQPMPDLRTLLLGGGSKVAAQANTAAGAGIARPAVRPQQYTLPISHASPFGARNTKDSEILGLLHRALSDN